MFQHIQLFLSLGYHPFSLMDHFRFRRVCCARHCLGGPYPSHCPPYILSISLGCCLLQSSIFGAIQGFRFIICVHCEGFNHNSLVARLLGASLASTVLRGHFSLALLWCSYFTLSFLEHPLLRVISLAL